MRKPDGRLKPGWWSYYKRHFVRLELARGTSRAVLASRLGITRDQLCSGIHNHGLDRPEAAHA